jgi:hypothetical protein
MMVSMQESTAGILRMEVEVVAGNFNFKKGEQAVFKFDVPATSMAAAWRMSVCFAAGMIGRAYASLIDEETGLPAQSHIKIGQVFFESFYMSRDGDGVIAFTAPKEALKASRVDMNELMDLQEKSINLVVVRKVQAE